MSFFIELIFVKICTNRPNWAIFIYWGIGYFSITRFSKIRNL